MLLFALVLAHAAENPAGHQLRARSAHASSYLQSNWNKHDENYHPNYILDGDPATAWVEGVAGNGEDEWVEWQVSPISSAQTLTLRLRNGYQKSDVLLAANAAPKTLSLQAWFKGEKVADSSHEVTRSKGWQTLTMPLQGKGLDTVRLQVVESEPGSRYKDLCISDVETWVEADARYDELFEHAKHAMLTRWVDERAAQAAYFAALPPTYPFASTRYQSSIGIVSEGPAVPIQRRYLAHREGLKALRAAEPGYRMDVRQRLQPPDHLDLWFRVNEVMRWVDADRTLFESTEAWHQVDLDRIGPIHLEGTPDAPRRAAFEVRSQDSQLGRGMVEDRGWWVLSFDGQGRLERASYEGEMSGELDGSRATWPLGLLLELAWTEDGKVDEVTLYQGEVGQGSPYYRVYRYEPNQ